MQTLRLIERRALTPRQHLLRFAKPEGFAFKPGQFIRLGLPDQEKPGDFIWRGYSIASAPADATLDFLITSVLGGKLSPRLVALEPGSEALLDGGAEGALTPERIPGGRTLWLLATGSGLSPFVSILKDPNACAAWDDVVLVLSARTRLDAAPARMLAAGELGALPEGRRLTVYLALTREADIRPEEGEFSGRIPALIESGVLEAASARRFTPEDARVLLCGNPGFIDETRKALKARGIVSPRFGKPGQLVVENFW